MSDPIDSFRSPTHLLIQSPGDNSTESKPSDNPLDLIGSDACPMEVYTKFVENEWRLHEDEGHIYMEASYWNINSGVKDMPLSSVGIFLYNKLLSGHINDEGKWDWCSKKSKSPNDTFAWLINKETRTGSLVIEFNFKSNGAFNIGSKKKWCAYSMPLPPKVDMEKEPKIDFWKGGEVRITFYKKAEA